MSSDLIGRKHVLDKFLVRCPEVLLRRLILAPVSLRIVFVARLLHVRLFEIGVILMGSSDRLNDVLVRIVKITIVNRIVAVSALVLLLKRGLHRHGPCAGRSFSRS